MFKESKKGQKVCLCAHTCVLYICFTSKCFCYESLPEVERMTVNGIISETWRVKGGIQIKCFSLAIYFLYICIITVRTPSMCVCVCVSMDLGVRVYIRLNIRGHRGFL